MKLNYSQKELKEEYMRRHAKDLENTPIYCKDGKYVTSIAPNWKYYFCTFILTSFVWAIIFYCGYDVGQSFGCTK